MISRNKIVDEVTRINQEQTIRKVFSDATERMTTDCKVKLSPSIVALASKLTFQRAFVDGVPKFELLRDSQGLLSRLNLGASSGYPLYVKKRHLKREILQIQKDVSSGIVNSLFSGGSCPFSIFTRIQAKSATELSFRLFYAPPYQWTVLETMLGA